MFVECRVCNYNTIYFSDIKSLKDKITDNGGKFVMPTEKQLTKEKSVCPKCRCQDTLQIISP